jgi:hypothetical protein
LRILDTEIEINFDFENVEIENFITCYIFYHYFSLSDVLFWLISFFIIIIIFKFYILYQILFYTKQVIYLYYAKVKYVYRLII